MSSPDTKPNRLGRLALAAAIPLVATACQDYAARRDTIAFHAGEAAAHNKAVHIIDPWPAAASRTNLDHDGARAAKAIERYEAGNAAAPPAAGMTINVPMPGAAPAP